MSSYYTTYIRFLKPLSDEELFLVNKAIKELEPYDTPTFTHTGLNGVDWRKPSYEVEGIMNLLHTAGFPSEGDQWYNPDPGGWHQNKKEPEWVSSKSSVHSNNDWSNIQLEEAARFLGHFGKFRFIKEEA